ncbi:MAG: hypothetical protein D6731_04365 [Planctomycetota bacterium]|nr:MAG: hypothetical protein D6731_04365 [Planctomycetota bacterium]
MKFRAPGEDENGKGTPPWLPVLIAVALVVLAAPVVLQQLGLWSPPAVGDSSTEPKPPSLLDLGVRALLAGDFPRARKLFAQARAQTPEGSLAAKQRALLDEVARIWSTQPFDRDAARKALAALEELRPLPPGLTSWIAVERSKRGLK